MNVDIDARTVTDDSGFVMPIEYLSINGVQYGKDETPDIDGDVECIVACGPNKDGQWLSFIKKMVGQRVRVN